MPLRKSKKSDLIGRVGMAAEKQQLSRTINVQPKTEETLKISEEVAPLDEALFFDEHGRFKKNVADNPDFEVVLESECPIQMAEEEIEITNVVKASGEIIKKRKMNFSKEEECTILGKQMLTDESINIAQRLLSKQFPKVCGFQDTVIGKLQEFDVIPTEKNYTGSLHWVFAANMESGKTDNEIHYSLFIFYAYHPGPQLTILSKSVQQQGNGVDCGVYAIAFATSLAYGNNPEKESYDKKRLDRT